MIVLKRNGREFQITHADLERIKALAIENGGDVLAAVSLHFEQKFGEPIAGASDPLSGVNDGEDEAFRQTYGRSSSAKRNQLF